METLSDSLNCDKADLWNKSDISEVSEILAHAIQTKTIIIINFYFSIFSPKSTAQTCSHVYLLAKSML